MQMRMKNRRFRLMAVLTLALCAGAAALACFRAVPDGDVIQAASQLDVAFVNASVVPMDQERLLTEQIVIVKDGRILEIGAATTVKIPAAALRVDGRRKYLMPGLADMHVHLEGNDEEVNQTLLRMFVAYGVTTVLNLYGTPHHLQLRQRIAKGEILGPALYASGPSFPTRLIGRHRLMKSSVPSSSSNEQAQSFCRLSRKAVLLQRASVPT